MGDDGKKYEGEIWTEEQGCEEGKIIHNKSKEVMDGHAEKIPKNVYVAEITVVRERPIDGDASL